MQLLFRATPTASVTDIWQGVSHSRTHFCWDSHHEYPAEALHPWASESFPTICGHGANSQFGPVLPTALPSGHSFASSVQAVLFSGGVCWVQPSVRISIIDKTANISFRKSPLNESTARFIIN
jgi:hypothetical protein